MTRRLVVLLVILTLGAAAAQQKSAGAKKTVAKKGADPAAGQRLFKENCAVCHWADKAEKRIGPGMKGLFKREKLFDSRPVSEENVHELILKGGGKMVGFEDKLEPKQVDAVMAYLKTL